MAAVFALSSASEASKVSAATTIEYRLNVAFTLGAIGTDLSITTHLLRNRDF